MGSIEVSRSIDWSVITDITPVSVIQNQKQVGLLVEYNYLGEKQKGLYRPEKYVLTGLDTRIPGKSEIYRDVAFHEIDKLLGWDVTVPITPWVLREGDKGVLRKYWNKVEVWQDYHYSLKAMSKTDKDFWTKVAVLDYICGVVDRNANDVLFLSDGEKRVADSGLSFVPELDFVFQHSRVRDEMKGQSIEVKILKDISLLNMQKFQNVISEYVTTEDLGWVIRRARFLASLKVII